MNDFERRVYAQQDEEIRRYDALPPETPTLERLRLIYEGGARILAIPRPPSLRQRLMRWLRR